jgi:hypothetical protein
MTQVQKIEIKGFRSLKNVAWEPDRLNAPGRMRTMKHPKKRGTVNRKDAERERRHERAQLEPRTSSDQSEAAIQRMVDAGLLRPATKPWRMPEFTPRPLRGGSIVQTLREERDSD